MYRCRKFDWRIMHLKYIMICYFHQLPLRSMKTRFLHGIWQYINILIVLTLHFNTKTKFRIFGRFLLFLVLLKYFSYFWNLKICLTGFHFNSEGTFIFIKKLLFELHRSNIKKSHFFL